MKITKDYILLPRNLFPHKHDKIFWRMGNGNNIAVSAMTDNHLMNTIKLIKSYRARTIKFPRNGRGKQAWTNIFLEELRIRKTLRG